MDLSNKVAVVTGGASGLGRATTDVLAAGGAKIAIFDLNAELGAEAVKALGEDKAGFWLKRRLTLWLKSLDALTCWLIVQVLVPRRKLSIVKITPCRWKTFPN